MSGLTVQIVAGYSQPVMVQELVYLHFNGVKMPKQSGTYGRDKHGHRILRISRCTDQGTSCKQNCRSRFHISAGSSCRPSHDKLAIRPF